MKHLERLAFGLVIACGALAFSAQSYAYKGEDMAKDAKLTMDQAAAIALNTRQGTIKSEMLEHKADGKGLQYAFMVNSGGVVYDVVLDADSGDILTNKPEQKK